MQSAPRGTNANHSNFKIYQFKDFSFPLDTCKAHLVVPMLTIPILKYIESKTFHFYWTQAKRTSWYQCQPSQF